MNSSLKTFERYQRVRLERWKGIGVPNMALEMAERKVRMTMYPGRPATMEQVLDAVEALGAAKLSTAQHERLDLFRDAEGEMARLRPLAHAVASRTPAGKFQLTAMDLILEEYENMPLEDAKRIGVPNLALELAERKVQETMWPDRQVTMLQIVDAVEALGAAKFSTAHWDRRDLFENAEQPLERLRHLAEEMVN